MNKLLTFEGGQPLVTGDLDFLQQCYAGVLEALGKALSQDVDCVLYGIEDDGTGQYSAGAVCIGGEVLLVPSPVNIGTARYLCFRQTDKEEREFADNQSHKVYRVVEPYAANTTEGAYKYMEISKLTRLADVLSGEAFWKKMDSAVFPEGVSGHVEFRSTESDGSDTQIRITAYKPANGNNLLFNYSSIPGSYIGITADPNYRRFYTITANNGECRICDATGSGYNGDAYIRNAVIKRIQE